MSHNTDLDKQELVEDLIKDFIELADNYDDMLDDLQHQTDNIDEYIKFLKPIYYTDHVVELLSVKYLDYPQKIESMMVDNYSLWNELMNTLSSEGSYESIDLSNEMERQIIIRMHSTDLVKGKLAYDMYPYNRSTNEYTRTTYKILLDQIIIDLSQNPKTRNRMLIEIGTYVKNKSQHWMNYYKTKYVAVENHKNYNQAATMILDAIDTENKNE